MDALDCSQIFAVAIISASKLVFSAIYQRVIHESCTTSRFELNGVSREIEAFTLRIKKKCNNRNEQKYLLSSSKLVYIGLWIADPLKRDPNKSVAELNEGHFLLRISVFVEILSTH